MTERILALDPGGTTGWACWQDDPIPGVSGIWAHFTIGQIGPEEHHEELYDFLEFQQTRPFSVVCETFDFRKHDNHREGVQLISREYIGVVKLFYAQRMRGQPGMRLQMQMPAQAKGFIPDKAKDGLEANAKLKALGLYVPGKKHSMDAMRHLLYFLINKKQRFDLIEPWKDLL